MQDASKAQKGGKQREEKVCVMIMYSEDPNSAILLLYTIKKIVIFCPKEFNLLISSKVLPVQSYETFSLEGIYASEETYHNVKIGKEIFLST